MQRLKDDAGPGQFQLKLFLMGQTKPKLVNVTPGETVDEVLEREGYKGRRASVNQRPVDGNYVLKDGEHIVVTQNLEAGASA